MKIAERRGFTLLELMLAMTVLALVAAICYGAFHLGIRAVERGEVAVVSAQRLRVATDVLIRQIKSAVAPIPARNRDGDVYPYFFGHGTSLTFLTANGLSGGGGVVRVCYYVAGEPPGLRMQETPFFTVDSLGRTESCEPNENDSVVLDNFRDLRFEYMMSDGIDIEWRADWNSHEEEALPTAVRIMVDGMPGLEVDRWGQEIPVMSALYGDNGTELGDEEEELASEGEDEGGPDDENAAPGTHGQKTSRDADDDDDEGGDE